MTVFKLRFFIFIITAYASSVLADGNLNNYQIKPVDYDNISTGVNAQKTWKKNNFTNYVYTIKNKCFCDIAKRAKVFVFNDSVFKILDLDNGKIYTDKEQLQKYKTINQIFEDINLSLQVHADKLYIDHDRYLGFPSKVFIDPSKSQIDDETNITISDLNLLITEQTQSPVE